MTNAMQNRTVWGELGRFVARFNVAHSPFRFGLIIKDPIDGELTTIGPPGNEAYVALATDSLQNLSGEQQSLEYPLPELSGAPSTLYTYRLNIPNPKANAPSVVAWCVGSARAHATDFFPLPFRDFSAWCTAQISTKYSQIDPLFLIGRAFQVGNSKLALEILCENFGPDAAILWLYKSKPKVFETYQVVGAPTGQRHLGLGLGIVGQLSPTRSQITYDAETPGELRPFHPDLFRDADWQRCQAIAVRFRGYLLGAISLYWKKGNHGPYVEHVEASRLGDLSYGLLVSERAELAVLEVEDQFDQRIRRLTSAQALVPFLHDVQSNLKRTIDSMDNAAVVLEGSHREVNRVLAGDLRRNAKFIEACLNRMARLTLLSPKHKAYERVDLRRLLLDNQQLISMSEAARVSVEAGPDPVFVRADRLDVERAVLNVVSNAVYWTETKVMGEKRIWVRLVNEARHAVVEVEDTGQGVGPEVRETLFSRFVTGRPDSGTGMGLFMVRETMRAHGGDITFRDRPGGGTVFRLSFPKLEAQR